MAFDPVTAALNLGSTILDRVLPDKSQNDAAKAQLAMAIAQGQFAVQIAQLQVDQAEANSKSVFVAGWRPFVGWSCASAFVYGAIVQPLIQFIAVLCHSSFDMTKLPHMDVATTVSLLLALLGMGAYRSYDKTQGTDNGH